MRDLNSLKNLEKDALREIANVGAGNAATAVSQLIGIPITVNVPKVSIIRVQDLPDPLGGPETVVAGIYLKLYGDAPGKMLLCLSNDSIHPVVELMLGPSFGDAPVALTEIQQSALKELGNILCSAYLNALARFMDMQLLPSVPALAVDMVSSILSAVLSESAETHPQALLIETQFSTPGHPITIHLFLIPEEGSLNAMLKALADLTGVKFSS
jgi:chemotaxis protein CheC